MQQEGQEETEMAKQEALKYPDGKVIRCSVRAGHTSQCSFNAVVYRSDRYEPELVKPFCEIHDPERIA